MEIGRISTKGQVVIPKRIRESHQWSEGQEIEFVDTPAGVLLRRPSPFPATELAELIARKKPLYSGHSIAESEWDEKVAESLRKEWGQ